VSDITTFLETELAVLNTMTGPLNVAENQIKTKDDNPIKWRYYPKNPKIKGEINARGGLESIQRAHAASPS